MRRSKLLTRPTIDRDTAGRLLKHTFDDRASDWDVLEAVCRQADAEFAADLAAIVARDEEVVRKFIDKTVDEVVTIPAKLWVSLSPRRGQRWKNAQGNGWRSTRIDMYPVLVPKTHAQLLGYAIAMLINDALPYGRDLRRCKLDGCGAFFLVKPTAGRRRERYCSENHMRAAHKPDASDRVMASRAGKTLAEFRQEREVKRAKKARQLAKTTKQQRSRRAS